MADHLPVRVARVFGGARHAGFGAYIGIGINIEYVIDAVSQPDVKPGIVAASDSLVCQSTGLPQPSVLGVSEGRGQLQADLYIVG